MTNKDVASQFNLLASFMELHGENAYRTKTYQNAYIQLRKTPEPIEEMTLDQIQAIKGVGKSVASKVEEILKTGTMTKLEEYRLKTPSGIQEMLEMKGFGAKKVRVIWKELGAETLGEVLYACNENRLIQLNGFGEKTQQDLKQKIEYFLQSKGKFHFAKIELEALNLLEYFKKQLPETPVSIVGELRRKMPIITKIEFLIGQPELPDFLLDKRKGLQNLKAEKGFFRATSPNDFPLIIYTCEPQEFGSKQFRYSASEVFMKAFLKINEGVDFRGLTEEKAVFEKANLPYIEPELRETEKAIEKAQKNQLPNLIQVKDIKGVVHAHSTYSDGYHTLEEMAIYSKSKGYEYLVITDHSKSAFYANGLKPERVLEQMAEIDVLNKKLAPFKIFKGIESDILSDGSLDYEADILEKFDCIIASVHSNLKMDKEKATTRLIHAIQNPFTTMLGHPTGRLLLSREGYPIDHEAVIDACATHGVAIEINANPYRLDLDWRWVSYALDKGVKISVNPDAHTKEGIHDIYYGIQAGRKGGLTAAACLNTLTVTDFEKYLNDRKTNRT